MNTTTDVGSQSMVAPLKRVIMKNPTSAWLDQNTVGAQWQTLNYNQEPDLTAANNEHKSFVEILESLGVEVLGLPVDETTGLDSVYTHDPAISTNNGVVLLNMGKDERKPEAAAMERALDDWGVPIAGWVDGDATAEGGDLLWLDEQTLVAGVGFRTNQAAVSQLRNLLGPTGVEVIEAHLPYWRGPDCVLHTMSLISMLADDLAVVHREWLPVPLYKALVERGIELIDIDPGEADTQACNVLAVSPRVVVMLEGNPKTAKRLEQAGCEVHTFKGENISLCGDGGPTCLTRPLLRR